jgi:UDP-GlcNAc:undecaprenyl-phosphate GlcNAc-1-phosphate transferase
VDSVDWWVYVGVLSFTTLLTLFLTPLALRFAVRRDVLDHPGAIKAQTSPVPYLGGAAIVGGFALVILAAAVIRPPTSGLDELVVIIGLGVVLAAVGLIDDLRGLSPWLRLALEVAAGVVVWATPAAAEVFTNDVLNLVVTVVWIVGITNAFNLLDNMDGLSAGVAAVSALFIFLLALDNGQFLVATLAIALMGCAIGFLRSNFHPARIYMGDAGALFIGFMLAVLALKLRFPDAPRELGLGVPIVLLGVPMFDTALVTMNRLRHHRSPLSGGRDHVSHRMVFVGIPVPATVTLIYGFAVSLGTLAFVLSRIPRTPGLVLLGWLAAVALLGGAMLSMVPVYETSRRRHLMLQEVSRHDVEPPRPFDARSSGAGAFEQGTGEVAASGPV